MEHICFLADVNRLYDYALGLYDLDLALSVVQQSQQVSNYVIQMITFLLGANLKQGSSRIPSLSTKTA